jgi:formylglycine-generating enzyme required for sulfatase activity
VVVLRQAITNRERSGDLETAMSAAKLGRVVAPDDAIFSAAVSRLTRRNGTTRVWPGDGKGMVWVEPHRYLMGASLNDLGASNNEHPAHPVSVGGFWVDRTEVTNDEYRSCVRAGACTPPQRAEEFDDSRRGGHPVLWVDWFQAKEYALWAGKRLPTEAEWELAARNGVATEYPWGTSWVPGRANAMGAYRTDFWADSSPVASFEASKWGIYDLIGNAAEWTEDVYHDSFYGAPGDGRAWIQETGPAGERRRVVRGGAFDDSPQRQRASKRTGRRPENPSRSVGFRCVADE